MINKNQRKTIITILLLISLLVIMNTASAATYNVDPGESIIQKINGDTTGENITIILKHGEEYNHVSDVDMRIDKNVTIKSSDPSKNAIIDLKGAGRAFSIETGGSLTLQNINIINGKREMVGAIYNRGTLIAEGCTFRNNQATTSSGGAIYNDGDATFINCFFIDNLAAASGGAIQNRFNLNVIDCTFTGNRGNLGGAIYTDINSNVIDCIFTGNQANNGKEIFNSGILTVNDCTFTNGPFLSGIYYYSDNNIFSGDIYTSSSATTIIGPIIIVSGTGVHGTSSVDVTVDVPDRYSVYIRHGNIVLFYDFVEFTSLTLTQTVTFNTDLDIKNTYTISVYSDDRLRATGLVQVLDYPGLKVVIDSVDVLDQKDYTSDSWTSLQSVLTTAKTMFNDKTATTQQQITDKINELNKAMKELVMITPADNPNKPSDSVKPTVPSNPYVTFNSPVLLQPKYNNLVRTIDAVGKLDSKKYSPASWNSLKKALANARNMNKAKNAKSQVEIDAVDKALKDAKSKLTKRNADLQITKVKRFGNSYKITIKNFGKDVSTKTRLKISASDKYVKTPSVKAIAAGKSITLTVKFFKYSQTKSLTKRIQVNYNKQATETDYKNNIVKIPRITG